MTKKVFLCLLLASSAAIADNVELLKEANEPIQATAPSIRLEGIFDFNTITRSQPNLKDKNLSANNENLAFNTTANITAKLEAATEQLKYGAKVIFITTAAPKKTPNYNGSYLFVEAEDFGRIELGSPFDVSTNMQIAADDVTFASGGSSWVSILNTNPNKAYGFDINAGDFYLSNFTSKNLNAVDRETSRKINYYTPVLNGFQFGVSYIPDTTNGGADKRSESNSYADREIHWLEDSSHSVKKYNVRYGAKNAFALGLSYEAEIAEATSFKVAVTGEFGQALQEAFIKSANKGDADYQIDPEAIGDRNSEGSLVGRYKIKNLRSYNIGAKLTHGNFSYAASYGDLCKSFTSDGFDPEKKDTNFYTLGVAYKQGAMGASLTYLGGNNKGNKFNSIALGSEYTIAPGLVSYGEVAYAKGTGKGQIFDRTNNQFPSSDQSFKGTSFLLGLKVKI